MRRCRLVKWSPSPVGACLRKSWDAGARRQQASGSVATVTGRGGALRGDFLVPTVCSQLVGTAASRGLPTRWTCARVTGDLLGHAPELPLPVTSFTEMARSHAEAALTLPVFASRHDMRFGSEEGETRNA